MGYEDVSDGCKTLRRNMLLCMLVLSTIILCELAVDVVLLANVR